MIPGSRSENEAKEDTPLERNQGLDDGTGVFDFIETVYILSEHARLKARILVHGEPSSNVEYYAWTVGKSCS